MTFVQSNTNLSITLRETSIEHFNAIYDQYSIAVYKFALKYTKSKQDAEDITQESFTNLWIHLTRIRELENIKGYLFRVTRNNCHNYIRRLTRNEYLIASYNKYETRHSNQDWTIEKECNTIYQQAINLLSVKQKQVYILRDSDLSQQEIACRLELSKYTINNHISTALKKIRSFVCDELQIRIEEEKYADCSNQQVRAA